MALPQVLDRVTACPAPPDPADVAAEFVGQIATAVWLGQLSDEAAREALGSFALACAAAAPGCGPSAAALMREYRRRREQQDVCS